MQKDVLHLFLGIFAILFWMIGVPNIATTIKSNKVSNDTMFNDSMLFKKFEQIKNIEQKSEYRISKAGKDFIKSKEDCRLNAYNDPDPKRRSVGYGHQIQPGENLETITMQKADELFEKDIEWVNDAINRLISENNHKFIYTQGFIDGLGDLIYNCGVQGVRKTEFFKRWKNCRYDKNSDTGINQNDFNYTIAAVKTARISARGHIERRYQTHQMMLN